MQLSRRNIRYGNPAPTQSSSAAKMYLNIQFWYWIRSSCPINFHLCRLTRPTHRQLGKQFKPNGKPSLHLWCIAPKPQAKARSLLLNGANSILTYRL